LHTSRALKRVQEGGFSCPLDVRHAAGFKRPFAAIAQLKPRQNLFPDTPLTVANHHAITL
jgi:hypothetical protein